HDHRPGPADRPPRGDPQAGIRRRRGRAGDRCPLLRSGRAGRAGFAGHLHLRPADADDRRRELTPPGASPRPRRTPQVLCSISAPWSTLASWSTLAPSSGTFTATAPSRTATSTADSVPWRRHDQWLNTMFRVKTTITVEVMLDPKMTWKLLGKCS